jgi:digeranylgeranylglycerophospholipid reductase
MTYASYGSARSWATQRIRVCHTELDEIEGRTRPTRLAIIPGPVARPVCSECALLIGDAAGIVSPVTAGGIHTALKHVSPPGTLSPSSSKANAKTTSVVRRKLSEVPHQTVVRFLFDHFQSDLLFNAMLASRPMRMAANPVYFHRRSVMKPATRAPE